MKKTVVLVLACVLLVSLFAGCKKAEEVPTAGLANPMVETDEAGMEEAIGMGFGTVAEAEDVQYFVVNQAYGEMQFTVNGISLDARIQSTAEFTDISGMYYEFDTEEAVEVGYCEGKLLRTTADGNEIALCLWYDAAPGVMYSLSGSAEDLSKVDFAAIANQLFEPTQGDAE